MGRNFVLAGLIQAVLVRPGMVASVALSGFLALSGCAQPPASIMTGDISHLAPKGAGQSLVGESCHYEPAETDAGGAFVSGYNVFCGRWEQPSAHVLQGLPDGRQAGNDVGGGLDIVEAEYRDIGRHL